jgi:siroheme synthase
MKQVVNKLPVANVVHFGDLVNPHLRAYVAVNPNRSVCLLMHEPQGYIFRDVTNHVYGHSGHHETISKTISKALRVGETQVFEFPNLLDAAAYIACK